MAERKRRRLGALNEAISGAGANQARSYRMVNPDHVRPDPAQPRKAIDEDSIRELADSMLAKNESGEIRGIVQALSVRPDKDNPNLYIINMGERRWRAAKLAGLQEIPVVIRENSSFAEQLIENIQREDLSTEDMAAAIEHLAETGLSSADIGRQLGKNRDWVSLYRQFNTVPELIAALHREGVIQGARAAVELARAYDKDPGHVGAIIEQIRFEGVTNLSRRALMWRLERAGETNGAGRGTSAVRQGTTSPKNGAEDRQSSTGASSITSGKTRSSQGTSQARSGTPTETRSLSGCAVAVSWSDATGNRFSGYLAPHASDDKFSIQVITEDGGVKNVLAGDISIIRVEYLQ